MSGIQIPWLGYSFMILGVLLLIIPAWPAIRKRVSDSLEVKILPNKWLGDYLVNGKRGRNPSYTIVPGHSLSAIFDLFLANHSQSYKAHIKSGNIVLKRRIWFWNGKTLFSLPLQVQSHPNNYSFENIDIEAQSQRQYSLNTGGEMPIISPFPRRSRLMLVLELIGATQRIERVLEEFKHDPKQVPDIPDWKRQ